ncbi:Dynein regulatory complex subunit 7 [Eumeta japonica]|uniref:Dynein regulatory complex subunit 7 n=1 Tax=Eumeta variegata TaxID=151549 RepID=A0A4C1TV38_EUMVA|nr:Dynein regulatory complex subunit 7 [Eumeta japonica]
MVQTDGRHANRQPSGHLLVTETYGRNPEIPIERDIYKRIFNITDNTIELLYHYHYNCVTNDTRLYRKPNLAETGGRVYFDPSKVSGYLANPIGKEPRKLEMYLTLCEHLELENLTRKAVRDSETDLGEYLKKRHTQLRAPTTEVALFDTERNEAAKKGWKEQASETLKAEVEERETEAEIDPLAPYLGRLFGSGRGAGAPLSYKDACLLREQCINDFRAKQLVRQQLVQERYDKLNEEYKQKRLWYLANQYILTPKKEAEYFASSAELAFQVHALEVRLTRHRDLTGPRFRALVDILNKHPLLKEHHC